MNLNELKQIEEGIFSAIKDRFQQGKYQTDVQNIFIKDFVQDAFTSLNNGVKSGLVDVSAKSSGDTPPPPGASPAPTTPPSTPPSTPPAPTTPPSTPPAPTTPTTPAPAAGLGDIRKAAGAAGKEAKLKSDEKFKTIQNEKLKKYGIQIGDVVTVNDDGKKVTGVITGSGFEEAEFHYRPKGHSVSTLAFVDDIEDVYTPSPTSGTSTTKESRYHKMNRIFESIINIDEEAGASSISEFMMDWFGKYMQGVNWEPKKQLVQQKLNTLQDEYPKNLKKNLTDLARFGLALSKTETPAGAPPAFTQSRKQGAASIEDFKTALNDLAKSDPDAYNNLIKTLKPVTPTPGASAGLAEEKKN